MTLRDLRERVTQATDSRHTRVQIDAALNQGLRLWSLITLCVERTVVLRWPTDQPFVPIYAAVPDFLVPLRVRCHVLTNAAGGDWGEMVWDSQTWGQALADGV